MRNLILTALVAFGLAVGVAACGTVGDVDKCGDHSQVGCK